ncbi:MAG: UDP-3-O-acyl-N-acetylglucosamine deacetylase [Gammaproteobacteria bacterium]|nr:UDP-3-O-acyl-N-acetylglucosamine deacetylase [Gammaproteobacteria bacterium]
MLYTITNAGYSQNTIGQAVHCIGIGLHSGHRVSMTLLPAPPNSGINFVRTDIDPEHALIRASWRNVVDTRMCTVLGNEYGITLGTVEHLMAALRTCGIDNLTIEIDSDEVPILDGSSAPLVTLAKKAGLFAQRLPRYGILIEKPVEVRQGEHYARLQPSPTPSVSVEIDFADSNIGSQRLSVPLLDTVLERDIMPARTFGFAHQLDGLREDGLALGGSLKNAVLLDDDGIVNVEGLRYADEFVRHKILDCIGDLALAGLPIFGELVARKPGHRLNHALLRELFAHRNCWSRMSYRDIVEGSPAELETGVSLAVAAGCA